MNRLILFIARRRIFNGILRAFNYSTARFSVLPEIQIWIPLQDRTGPAFYLNYGGPGAFYHYEETEKTELLRHLPNDGVFLDIGANIGLFSFYFANALPRARAFAFEPNPELIRCLQASARENQNRNVEIISTCLSDEAGETELILHRNNSGGNSILRENIGADERGESVMVPTETLDGWALRTGQSRIDAIKIDVQGAEHLVLAGALTSIDRFRPAILVEIEAAGFCAHETKWNSILTSLSNFGYRFRKAGDRGTEPISTLADRIRQSENHVNFFLIPPSA